MSLLDTYDEVPLLKLNKTEKARTSKVFVLVVLLLIISQIDVLPITACMGLCDEGIYKACDGLKGTRDEAATAVIKIVKAYDSFAKMRAMNRAGKGAIDNTTSIYS